MAALRQTVDRYELVGELGRGGMAIVYLARQVDLDRLVALKELGALHTAEPSFARRFLREAQLAGSLSHPNIVTVYDYFDVGGTPCIAMEYLEHGTLRPHVGRMSLAEIGGVLEAVLAGLSLAEQQDIVHRDLKPENLLVAGDGRVKISDFGIAKAMNQVRPGAGLTSTGVAVGTPNYMAPEQATARGVGPWTDLYAVGIMAFEFFIGRAPFGDTDNAVGVLLRQVSEAIPAVNELDGRVDARISDWIARMVAKEPSERPESAAAAWDEIEDVFLALLGPRWRRESRLAAVPEAAVMPLGPATGRRLRAPVAPLTDEFAERSTAPLANRRQAATLPPREALTTPPPEVARSSTKGWGRRAATIGVALAVLVAAATAAFGRGGSRQPAPAAAPTSSPQTTAAAPESSPQPAPTSQTSTPPRRRPLTTEANSAHRLAAQYQSSAARIARLDGARTAGSPTARLVVALRRTAAAYRIAESAALTGDVAGYAAAIQQAEVRKRDVNAVVAELRAARSAPTQPSQTTPSVQPTPCSGDSVSDDPSDEGC
jgi:serine/threonine protein kinase